MTIPTSVRIGPHAYTVRTDHDTGKLLHDEGSRGDSRPAVHLIRLDVDRPHTAIAETLLHEVLHCAWDQTSMRTSANLNDHEEAIITALAPLLLGALRDNPDLVEYLTAVGT